MLIGVTGVNVTSPQTSTPQAGGIGMEISCKVPIMHETLSSILSTA